MVKLMDLSLDEIINERKRKEIQKSRGRSLPSGGLHRTSNIGRVTKIHREQNKSWTHDASRPEDKRWTHDAFLQMEQEDRKPSVIRRQESAKVDIGNLSRDVTTEDLIELFNGYNLVKTNVHYDEAGLSLGTADAKFAGVGDATRMMKDFVGLKLDGRLLKMTLVGGIVPSFAPFTSRLSGGRLSRGREERGPRMQRGGGRGGMNRRSSVPIGWQHDPRLLSDKDGDSDGGRRGQTAFGKKRGPGGDRGDNKRPMTEAQLDAELDAYMKKPAKMES